MKKTKPMRLLSTALMSSVVANVIIPRPPNWIKTKITIWPNNVKSCPVSSTVNPVTQIAEVDVNNASITLTPPDVLLNGNSSSIAPTIIAAAK